MCSRDLERNPPAFPVSDSTLHDYRDGMELRDWFAGVALEGCLSYSYCNSMSGNWQENASHGSIAQYCYEMADAMLAERAKGRDSDV